MKKQKTDAIVHMGLVIGALVASAAVHAAEAETDVIGVGKTQLEFKLARVRDANADLREKATPFLARMGLTETLELRLATEGRLSSTSGGVTDKGWADTQVGLRIKTREANQETGASATAWQLEVGLPTGSSVFKASSASYAVKYATEWALSDTASLAVMPGVTRQRNGANDWYSAPYVAITAGKNWSPEWRTVVEWVGEQFTSQTNGGNVSSLKLGTTYALTQLWEFEAVYSRGLTNNTPKHGIEFGLNVKF